MKKALALIVALCLFCMSSAFAEYIASDGTPLQLENFTLNLEAGMIYTAGERVPDEVYITVFPLVSSGDGYSNFNFVPSANPGNVTTDMVNTFTKTQKQEYIDALESQGATVNSMEFIDAEDFTISGIPCVLTGYTVDFVYSNQPMIAIGRQLYVGEKGYVITFTSSSEENIWKMTELLETMLTWN